MTAQFTALDVLIGVIADDKVFAPDSTIWVRVFPGNAPTCRYKLLQAFYGSLDAAKALRDALGVDTPIDIDARKWLLGILRDHRAKITGK